MMEVTLPWPPSGLSPNSRLHWRRKSAIARQYRDACFVLARNAGLTSVPWEGPIVLELDFVPPDRRSRDDDNLIAAFKSGRDGLARALGIDDKRFQSRPVIRRDEVGGMVKVRLCPVVYGGNEWNAD